MPTGYTHAIEKGITFPDFVMQCSRAMGALIMMRDERSDAPIPERFEPSDYHPKKIAEMEAELKAVNELTPDQCALQARAEFDQEIANRNGYIQKARDLETKYRDMLKDVRAWTPPTKDHQGLKDFMIQQIESSIEFDCGTEYWERQTPVLKPWADWRRAKSAKIHQDLTYHRTEYAKEVERTEDRNNWISELRRSLQAS